MSPGTQQKTMIKNIPQKLEKYSNVTPKMDPQDALKHTKNRGADKCKNISKKDVKILSKSMKNGPWSSTKNDAQKHTPKNRKKYKNDSQMNPKR